MIGKVESKKIRKMVKIENEGEKFLSHSLSCLLSSRKSGRRWLRVSAPSSSGRARGSNPLLARGLSCRLPSLPSAADEPRRRAAASGEETKMTMMMLMLGEILQPLLLQPRLPLPLLLLLLCLTLPSSRYPPSSAPPSPSPPPSGPPWTRSAPTWSLRRARPPGAGPSPPRPGG